MSESYLKNIKRTLFVVIGEELFISKPDLKISHGEWFRREGWTDGHDSLFIEKNPRGYIDEEGIYLYQGHDARTPKITEQLLKKTIKVLSMKVKIDHRLHIFTGTVKLPSKEPGKLLPQHDLGPISNYL